MNMRIEEEIMQYFVQCLKREGQRKRRGDPGGRWWGWEVAGNE